MGVRNYLSQWISKETPIISISGVSASAAADDCHRLHHSGVVPHYEDILASGYRRFLKAGDIAVDIGVNHGIHFDRLKKCVGPTGHVVGFEPVPDFVAVVQSRHGKGIDLRQKALSSEPGRGQFLHMTKAIGESGFKERDSEGDRGAKTIYVEISTLDAELGDAPRIDFIKIDTEGHELSALRGGGKVIARTRPIISAEYGKPTYSLYGLTAESLHDWTEQAGYQISDLFGNIVRSREEWLYVCDRSYWDYFLIPKERSAWWTGLRDLVVVSGHAS